jgi:hypothetical protein
LRFFSLSAATASAGGRGVGAAGSGRAAKAACVAVEGAARAAAGPALVTGAMTDGRADASSGFLKRENI